MEGQMPQEQGAPQAQQELPPMDVLMQGLTQGIDLLAQRLEMDGAPPEMAQQVVAKFKDALMAVQGGGQDAVGPQPMETGGRPAQQVL